MKSKTLTLALFLFISYGAYADSGKIKICRNQSIVSMSDNKVIQFPPLSYVGLCDRNGANCRKIEITADGGSVGKEKAACAIVNGNLTLSDGSPVKAGTKLTSSYSSMDDFRNKGYSADSENLMGNALVTTASDFK